MDKTSTRWSCSSIEPAPPSMRCTWKRTGYGHPWRLRRWQWSWLTRIGLWRRRRLPLITATITFESASHCILPLTFLFFFQSSSHPRIVGHGALEHGVTSLKPSVGRPSLLATRCPCGGAHCSDGGRGETPRTSYAYCRCGLARRLGQGHHSSG